MTGLDRVQRLRGVLVAAGDPPFPLAVRVPDPGPEEEPVQLGLGQGEGPLELDRVLRREDEERVGQEVGRALDRDLALLHRLQQRRLRPRRGAVDLVDEEQVREHRPRHEAQAAGLEQAGPGDVRGKEVRRALDPGHPQVQGAGDGAGEERLAGARDVLEQDVAVRQQRHRDHPQRLVRPDHRPRDGAAEVVPQPAAGAEVDTGLGRARARARARAAVPGTSAGAPAAAAGAPAARSASMDRWLLCGGGFAGLSEAYRPGGLRVPRSSSPARNPVRRIDSPRRPAQPPSKGHARVAAVARPHPRPARFDPRPRRGLQDRPAHGQDQPELGRVRGRDRHDPGAADGHRGRAPPGGRRGDEALPADRRRGRLSRARARAGPGRRPRGRDLRAGARDPDAGRHRRPARRRGPAPPDRRRARRSG